MMTKNINIYARPRETIERVFANVQAQHDMRWTTLRGIKKLSIQGNTTFATHAFKLGW